MSKKIGAYQVIARLDEGGRPEGGERYLVEGSGGARFRICLLPAPADEDAWEQAQLEARVASNLDHEAVLAVVDTFEEEGRLAIVSETLPGALTVAQLLADDEPVPPRAVWHVGREIIGAFALSHAAADDDGFYTICHGHLGPERVLVDPGGRVCVEGLGLAPLAAAGVLAGPAAYEPPEQAGGGRVTPRGDIFSLTALMWALLESSEPPQGFDFEGRKELSAAAAELLGRACQRSVGKRKVLSMEMEEVLQSLDGGQGQQELGDAVSRARPRATLVGAGPAVDGKKTKLSAGVASDAPAATTKRSGIDPLATRGRGVIAGPRQGKGEGPSDPPRTTSPQLPRMRSKEPTMLGGSANEPPVPPPRGKLPSAPPMDWGAAEKAAREGSQVTSLAALLDDSDDLDWGDEEQATQLDRSPNLEGVAGVVDEDTDGATMVATSPPVGVTKLDDEDSDDGHTDVQARPSWLDSKGAHRPQSLSALDPPSVLEPEADEGKDERKPATKSALAHLTTGQDPSRPPRPAPSSPGSSPASSPASSPGSGPGRPDPEPAPPPPASKPSSPGPSDDGPAISLDFGDDSEESLDDRERDTEIDARPAGALDDAPGEAAVAATGRLVEPSPPVAFGGSQRAEPASESPWSADTDPPAAGPGSVRGASPDEPAPSEPISKGTAVLLSVATAIAVMVIGVWYQRRDSKVVVPPLPPSAVPAATASATATARPRPILAAPTATASASATATATASASASASAAPSASASADPSADDLLYTQGYLIVTFEGPQKDAKVFLFGKDYGKVGDKLVVPCERPAFVTVGTAPNAWLSAGQPVQITCRGTTRVTIKPK